MPVYCSFARTLAVAGRIPCNRVCQSLLLDICLGVFLELDHQISLDFARVLVTIMKLCMAKHFFLKILFCPQNWRNGPKISFLNFKKNLLLIFSEFAL